MWVYHVQGNWMIHASQTHFHILLFGADVRNTHKIVDVSTDLISMNSCIVAAIFFIDLFTSKY